jgi:hypothetical protein
MVSVMSTLIPYGLLLITLLCGMFWVGTNPLTKVTFQVFMALFLCKFFQLYVIVYGIVSFVVIG